MRFFRRKYIHEVFISHAFEDKAAIADELCARLKAEGLRVWYSGDQLATGEDLHKAIEKAIDQSRFGVVIFSKIFITRPWPLKELSWLEAKEKEGMNVILPVRFNMSMAELAEFSPRIAAKFCIDASRGMDYVIRKILDQIQKERDEEARARKRRIAWTSLVAFVFMLFAGYLAYSIITHRPAPEQVKATIDERVNTCLNTIESRYLSQLKAEGIAISQVQIDSVRKVHAAFNSLFRNEYELNDCHVTIRGRRNVEAKIHRDLVVMADQPGYGMDSVDMYWVNKSMADGFRHSGFSIVNNRPVEYTWHGRSNGDAYVVDVTYTNEIRYINVSLTLPPMLNGTKRHEMTLLGFAPSESYYFEEGSDGEWYFTTVE